MRFKEFHTLTFCGILLFTGIGYLYGDTSDFHKTEIPDSLAHRNDPDKYFTSVHLYTKEDGLSDNTVTNTYQDSRNFLWLSTASGLNRFDGHDFVHYTKDNCALASNYIEEVFEDKNGKLWVVSRGQWNTEGLSFYSKNIDILDPQIRRATSIEAVFDLPFEQHDMRWFFEDHHKNIWISTKQGALYKYDGIDLQFIVQSIVAPDWLGRFAISSRGDIGVLNGNKVTIFDSLGQHASQHELPYACVLIYAGLDGDFWIANTRSYSNDKGALRVWFIRNNQILEPYPFRDWNLDPYALGNMANVYTSFRMDPQGRFWGFADESLLLFNKEAELIYDFSEILRVYDIPAESIFFNLGRDDILWLSTEKGAISIALRHNRFESVLGPTDYAMDPFIIDDVHGNVFISKEELYKISSTFEINKRIPLENAMVAAKDNAGNIWWGDRNYSFHLHNPHTDELLRINDPDLSKAAFNESLFIRRPLQSLYVNDITRQLFIGTREGGISVINQAGGVIQPYNLYHTFSDLQESVINFFYKTDVGTWLCTNNGLYLLNEKDGILAHYTNSENGIGFGDINFMHRDSSGIYWLATTGSGLIKWDFARNEANQFSLASGFSHPNIYAVYEDDFENLWLPSGYGLMQFSKHTNEVLVWHMADGLPFNSFVKNFHHQTENGLLFFGGPKGEVFAFFPSQHDRQTVPLTISAYQEYDNKLAVFTNQNDKVSSAGSIHIPPNVNLSLLKVALLDYTTPENIEYSFAIDPQKNNSSIRAWQYQKDNTIRLNNLTYGKHSLQIRAIGSNNAKTRGFIEISVFVEKPFYLKLWFLSLSFISLIGLIIALIHWRTIRLQKDKSSLELEVSKRTETIDEQRAQLAKQNTELQQANVTKDKLMAIIGHDLRGSLVSLQGLEEKINYLIETGQVERLKELSASLENSANFLGTTLNNLLNWSRSQMGSFPYHPEIVSLSHLASPVVNACKANCDIKEIELIFDVPEDLFVFADRNAVATILRNLLSNAVKFTPRGGHIAIKGFQGDQATSIRVSDSGIGMSQEQAQQIMNGTNLFRQNGTQGEKSTGLGLMVCRDLIIQNGGELLIESTIKRGTTFKVLLPKQK